MFTIKVKNPAEMLEAMFVLSHFQVKFHAFSDAENPLSTEIVVDEEMRDGDLEFAEMAIKSQSLEMFSFLPEDEKAPVNYKVEALESIPPKADPLHHDLTSMGVRINDRFHAAHIDRNFVDLTDMRRGSRVRITFPG